MASVLSSIIGLIIGVLIYSFKSRISDYLTRSYQRFPKYGDGVKAFKLRFEVRPFFIGILGLVIIIFSMIGFFK